MLKKRNAALLTIGRFSGVLGIHKDRIGDSYNLQMKLNKLDKCSKRHSTVDMVSAFKSKG